MKMKNQVERNVLKIACAGLEINCEISFVIGSVCEGEKNIESCR